MRPCGLRSRAPGLERKHVAVTCQSLGACLCKCRSPGRVCQAARGNFVRRGIRRCARGTGCGARACRGHQRFRIPTPRMCGTPRIVAVSLRAPWRRSAYQPAVAPAGSLARGGGLGCLQRGLPLAERGSSDGQAVGPDCLTPRAAAALGGEAAALVVATREFVANGGRRPSRRRRRSAASPGRTGSRGRVGQRGWWRSEAPALKSPTNSIETTPSKPKGEVAILGAAP
jgi:hypothetical protein